MQEHHYEKIRSLFFKLIEETKELSEDEFEKVLIEVFKANDSFSTEIKDRLVIDIAKMREKLLKNLKW